MTPEPLDPQKYHVLDQKKKNVSLIIAIFCVAVLLPILALVYYKFAVLRPAQNVDEVTLEVKGGENVSQIGSKLYANDVINSEFLFKLYVLINGYHENLQAGTYVIPSGKSIVEITEMLQNGRDDITITFLEGWRVEEFAEHASKNFDKIDYTEFVKLAAEKEGYLFPDTYTFNSNVTEQEMVDILRNTFNKKTAAIFSKPGALSELSMEEVLIFASILERETHNPEDRPIVAGILVDRWLSGDRIGADATTQYVVGPMRYGCSPTREITEACPDAEIVIDINWWPQDLTINELTLENPYNTRAVVGLPPAPISNPSLNAIEAVINHQHTDYYYYINSPDGTTHYAKTLEEHNQNISTYLN